MSNTSEWNRQYCQDRRAKRKSRATEVLGDSCFFCPGTSRMTIHRKDGLSHTPFHMMRESDWEAEITSGEYVRLCFRCHKGVHWSMEQLHLSWEKIVTIHMG